MSPILSSLRSLLPDNDLRAHMAARTAHHVPATGAIDPPSILTLDTIEQALARGVVPVSEMRVFGAYSQLDLARVGVVKDNALRPLVLRSLAQQGGTVVVNNAQRLTPELWDLACAAERWLGAGVTLAAVASFGQSGIELHYDSADLIIMHLDGGKRWDFFGPPVADSATRFTNHYGELPTEVTGAVEMRAGDLLYVPSGLFHRCTPGDYSLHLGMIVTYPSGEDYGKHLSELALAEARSGAPLPGFLGEAAVVAEAEAVKARMIAKIQASDPREWYAERMARRARVEAIGLRPGAAPEGGIAALNVTIGPEVTAEGKLSAANASVVWTPALEALTDLLRDGPRPVAALADLLGPAYSAEDVRAALTRLVDTGLIRIKSEQNV